MLVRNLLVGEGFTGLIRRAKKDATVMPSAIQHLNGISVGLFNASNRPTVRQVCCLPLPLTHTPIAGLPPSLLFRC